jgi:hypothetical protein
MKRSGFRPLSLAEVAERVTSDGQDFDLAVREFLDSFETMPSSTRSQSLADEPLAVGIVEDAYLAALAEHLSERDREPAPAWTEKPERFLHEPFFAGGLESLKAILIVESPSAFRRRLIFISADGLSRPHRAMVDDESPPA